MSSRLQRELTVASKAVQLCAQLTRRVQKDTLSPENTVQKFDYSPVTICDFAVQALLTSAIHEKFHGDAFLAEESADELRNNEDLLQHVWELIDSMQPAFNSASLAIPTSKEEVCDLIDLGGKQQQSNGPRTFVFDPIDGTMTFLKGQQYAINCAFLMKGKEEIGIIGCPNLNSNSSTMHEDDVATDSLGAIVSAVRGEGTWMRPLQDGPELAPATKVPPHGESVGLDGLIWSDCSTYTSTIIHLHQQIAAKLGTEWPGVDLHSSLVKYAALGLGKAHIVMRIFKYSSWRSNMWDHAGGVLIFEEAGGKITDLDGKSIDFSTGRKMSANYGLVCAPNSVHKEVLNEVQQVLQAHGPIPWTR